MYIIAEIGQAHEGSLGLAHSYIDAIADTGVHAIKFQTHIAEAESSIYEPFRVKFSYEDVTRMDYWKRMGFTAEQWAGLKRHCEDKGLEFISSPFSNAAVDLLESLDVRTYKIGSGEVTNLLMLEKIARTGKAVILSSGMSSYAELDQSVRFIEDFAVPLSILQCTTAYPTSPENWGLNVIKELKSRYNHPVGYSDHSGDIMASLAATALGAEILEFHVVFDRKMFGPDAKASIEIRDLKRFVNGILDIQVALTHPVDKSNNEEFSELKQIFEKSLAVNRNMKAGEIIQFSDLEAKKPGGYGMPAGNFKQILGKRVNRDIRMWDFINLEDIDVET